MSGKWKGILQQDNLSIPVTRFPRLALGLIALVCLLCNYVRRVYFHKLSGIPGPKVAAASHLYEAFYNIIGDGYFKRLIPMHSQYNFAKAHTFYKKLGIDGSILTICDPAEHKMYRNTVVSLFSRKAVDSLGPAIASELDKAAASMARQGKDGKHTVIQRVYRAIAIFKSWLDEAVLAHDSGKQPDGQDTFFDLIVKSRRKTGAPLDFAPLFDDVFNYIVAGMEATSYVLSFATYFLLTNPEVKAKLEAELFEAKPFIQEFDHRRIMALPYLTAVVKETLRLSNTVPGCLPRIVPKDGIEIGGYQIAGGTIISMVHPVIERDEKIFPEPNAFIPERWMGTEAQNLQKWAVAFSKGRRQCIATNLAYMELYATMAVFFSRFEMELFETTESDMQITDQFAPIINSPVKVKIVHDRWA
ncbi:MAG: hypothetical protein Q9191_004243 [Dirinaria sp. TL-2023a]